MLCISGSKFLSSLSCKVEIQEDCLCIGYIIRLKNAKLLGEPSSRYFHAPTQGLNFFWMVYIYERDVLLLSHGILIFQFVCLSKELTSSVNLMNLSDWLSFTLVHLVSCLSRCTFVFKRRKIEYKFTKPEDWPLGLFFLFTTQSDSCTQCGSVSHINMYFTCTSPVTNVVSDLVVISLIYRSFISFASYIYRVHFCAFLINSSFFFPRTFLLLID